MLDQIIDFVSQNMSIISMVGGFLLVAIAKIVPNSNAGPLISKVQVFVDMAAKLCEKAGKFCLLISDILSNIIKSNGYLGKD